MNNITNLLDIHNNMPKLLEIFNSVNLMKIHDKYIGKIYLYGMNKNEVNIFNQYIEYIAGNNKIKDGEAIDIKKVENPDIIDIYFDYDEISQNKKFVIRYKNHSRLELIFNFYDMEKSTYNKLICNIIKVFNFDCELNTDLFLKYLEINNYIIHAKQNKWIDWYIKINIDGNITEIKINDISYEELRDFCFKILEYIEL